MQPLMSGAGPTLEVDAIGILRSITPLLDPARHKGQAGDANLYSYDYLFYSVYSFFATVVYFREF